MVTKFIFPLLLASVTVVSITAKADLPESRAAIETNVVVPHTEELNALVERNEELKAWNEKHGGTITKLNAIVTNLNKPWSQQGAQENQKHDQVMRETLKAIWELETDKAIGTVTDLKGFIEEVRDRKQPGSKDQFQFSDITRRQFDGLLKLVNKILEDSKNEIDPITMMKRKMASVDFRKGPHDIDYPTIVQGANGLEATPLKPIETARIDSLREILKAHGELDTALQSCPDPKFLKAQIAKIVVLEKANATELTRIATEIAKANSDYTDAVQGTKGLMQKRSADEAKAQTDRDQSKHDTIRAALLAAMDFRIVSLDETKDSVALEGVEVSSDKAREVFIEAIVKDIRDAKFAKKDGGHKELMSLLEKRNRANISAKDPAKFEEFAGLPSTVELSKDLKKRDSHVLYVEKLDITKMETLPAKIKELEVAADKAYTTKMTAIKDTFLSDTLGLQGTRDTKLESLAKDKVKADAQTAKLTKERQALAGCQTKVGALIPRLKGLNTNSTKDDFKRETGHVEQITRESDVESLRPVKK